MAEGKGEGSDLKRELEEVAFKREAEWILANWREVPLGEKTTAGAERLKEGIGVEVIIGGIRGIQEAT